MKLSEIKQTIGTVATVTGDDDVEIRYLLTDSRQLNVQRDDVQCTKNNDVQSTKAAQTLFFAIKTEKNDGAKYIPELEKKGVRAFVTGDALAALQLLAAHVRSRFNGHRYHRLERQDRGERMVVPAPQRGLHHHPFA